MTININFIDKAGHALNSQVYSAQNSLVLSVNLSNTLIDAPAMNAGDVVGNISVVTFPPNKPTTPITISGNDASLFSVTNGGIGICQLIVGAQNVNAASYSISLTAN